MSSIPLIDIIGMAGAVLTTLCWLPQALKVNGLNPEGPFPFQIRGTLVSYVVDSRVAPTNGPHGMSQPIAITRESKGDAIAGMVAEIYVSGDLVGIVSHGGTRTHSHWLASDLSATAHLDRSVSKPAPCYRCRSRRRSQALTSIVTAPRRRRHSRRSSSRRRP